MFSATTASEIGLFEKVHPDRFDGSVEEADRSCKHALKSVQSG